MSYVAVGDGVDIFFTEHGSGPAVLMLHGWGCDGSDWIWLATDLASDHRVVVVDLRAHGRSGAGPAAAGPKTLADDAAQVLRHLRIDRAVVVAHSLGTLAASALAVEYPAMVTAAVLADPAYGYTDETLAPMITALRERPLDAALGIFGRMYVENSPPWQRLWHERRLRGAPMELIAEMFCAGYEGADGIGHRAVSETYLGRRRSPVLSVHSAASAALVAAWERALPHGPHDRIDIWSEAGHFMHQEQPDRFAVLTRSWLAGLAQHT